MARQRRVSTIVAVASLMVAVAGCNAAPPSTGVASTSTPTIAPLPSSVPATIRVTETPAQALELLWEASGDTATTGPEPGTYSPAVDPLTGDIWVSMSSGTVWIFESDGTYRGSFGEFGEGPGEFNFRRPACPDCPAAGALAFAPDGSLFVADVGNHRVQKFDPAHEFVTEWGGFGAGEGQFADAMQIATNGRAVFVSDDARQDTQIFDLDGTLLRALPLSGWLAVDPAGDLLVNREGTVIRFAEDGTEVDRFDLPDYQGAFHVGLAVDSRGRLFVDLQHPQTAGALGLGELDAATGDTRVWASGGETLAIAGDVVYQANYTGTGWPEPVLRAYALPER